LQSAAFSSEITGKIEDVSEDRSESVSQGYLVSDLGYNASSTASDKEEFQVNLGYRGSL
jgi:hypothetical protein